MRTTTIPPKKREVSSLVAVIRFLIFKRRWEKYERIGSGVDCKYFVSYRWYLPFWILHSVWVLSLSIWAGLSVVWGYFKPARYDYYSKYIHTGSRRGLSRWWNELTESYDIDV